MKKIFVISFFFLVYNHFSGQFWLNSDKSDVVNLYQVEAQFESHWKNKEYEKGKGYKQFKRWKNFWEPRLFPSGDFNAVDADYLNTKKQSINTKSADKNFGNWESLGIENWVSHSYNPGNGRINCIYQDPNDENIIFIGAASGGLWKTVNQGDSWITLTDQLPTLGISGIAVDYTNPDILYIATGDSEHHDVFGVGVLKSMDGGISWQTTGLAWSITQEITSVKLIMHPSNPNILFCATNNGLMKTINGGLTWISVLSGNIRDVEFKPGDPSVVYCTKKSLYQSTDNGDNFALVSDAVLPTAPLLSLSKIAVTPANPEVIYLFCADIYYGFQGMYKSSDSGLTWSLQANSPNVLIGAASGAGLGGQAWYDMAIAVSPVDENIVVVGGINLWKSTNSGVSWSLNSYWYYEPNMSVNFVHADIHHLEFVGDNLYCGSDGGIYISTDNSDSYQDLSEGLSITQFYKLGVSQQNSNLIIGGAQDNGTNLYKQNYWDHRFGGDGGECAFLPSDSSIVFCSTQNGGIRKSINGGIIFSPSDIGISEEGAWVTPYVISPLNDNYIYAAYQNVWRSTTQGDSWTKISDINDYLHAIAVGMNNPNRIYTSTYDDIYRTDDGGNVWQNISSGLPNAAITGIAIDPLNVDHVWVTFSGFSDGNKVYYSSNSGEDWVNISGNLPNVPVNCIVFDNQGDNGVYIGTDTGIYYTNDDLAHWEPFMNNFPNVIVTELEVHDGDQKIFASTFGRGIWRSNLFQIDQPPIVDFTFNPTITCEGVSVDFEDATSLGGANWEWSFEGASSSVSNEMNPTVLYENEGVYDVTLTVSNAEGSTTYTCQDCVEVFAQNSLQLPYQQNFESSDDLSEMTWYALDSNGWKLSTNNGFSNSQGLWIENYGLNANSEFEIISRPIALTADQAFLSFKYSYAQIDDTNNDALRVYYSVNCGQTWTLVTLMSAPFSLISSGNSIEPYFPQSSQDWNLKVVQLNENLIGEDVMFKFRFQDDHGNNLFIDDINIDDTPISINEVNMDNPVRIYPNPVQHILHIEGLQVDKAVLQIYTALGAFIESYEIDNRLNVVDIEHLTNGQYLYRILNLNKEELKSGKLTILK